MPTQPTSPFSLLLLLLLPLSKWGAYGQSKLSNILHAQELNKRLKQQGLQVTAYALHPGVIQVKRSKEEERGGRRARRRERE